MQCTQPKLPTIYIINAQRSLGNENKRTGKNTERVDKYLQKKVAQVVKSRCAKAEQLTADLAVAPVTVTESRFSHQKVFEQQVLLIPAHTKRKQAERSFVVWTQS